METSKNKKEQEFKTIKQELINDTPGTSMNNYSNNESGVTVKEEFTIKEEPTEEHFIEISSNSVSKMDQLTIEKAKALTKDETRKLLDLILLHPIITSKETNATNNQQKIIEWHQITEDFNSTSSVHRTPKQLRLKWENLKKNARRRNSKLRLNRGKTSAEYIPRDEILEKVSQLLRRRGSTLKPVSMPSPKEADDADSDDSDEVLVPSAMKHSSTSFTDTQDPAVPDEELDLPYPSDDPEANVMTGHKITNGFSGLQPQKKKFRTDEGREDRNRAIADYYRAKTKLLEANIVNANLQNEKLQLEVKLLKRKF